MADHPQELPPQTGLSKVDRKVVTDLLGTDWNAGKAEELDAHFSRFEEKFPDIVTAIESAFRRFGEDKLAKISAGAYLAGALLDESQRKNGGEIPQQVGKDAINATIGSVREKGRYADEAFGELLDADPEILLAATMLAWRMETEPSDIVMGALFVVDVFNHKLAGDKLEEELGL